MCSIFESYATDSQAGANSTVTNLEKDRRFVVAVKDNVHYLYVAEVAIIEINEIASAESIRCLYSEIIAVQRHASRNCKGSVDLDIVEKINRVACLCISQSLGKRIIGNAIYRGNCTINRSGNIIFTNNTIHNSNISRGALGRRLYNSNFSACRLVNNFTTNLTSVNDYITSRSLIDDIAVNSRTVNNQASIATVRCHSSSSKIWNLKDVTYDCSTISDINANA